MLQLKYAPSYILQPFQKNKKKFYLFNKQKNTRIRLINESCTFFFFFKLYNSDVYKNFPYDIYNTFITIILINGNLIESSIKVEKNN